MSLNVQRVARTAAALFIFTVSTCPAWAWGLRGHQIIGMIADIRLANDQAGADAKMVLGGASLSEAATWADCAKGRFCGKLSKDEKVYVEQNPLHRAYHYTDVPIQQSRYQLGAAGTRDNDIVQVTKQAINVLLGRVPNDGPAKLDRKSALWVMAHMVGDLHQPLHVGAIYFADDCAEPIDPNNYTDPVVTTKGGNYLMVSKRVNLHNYWDDGTVTGAMRLAGARKSVGDFANFIVANPPRDWKTTGDVATWPEQWATEILPIAKAALTDVKIGEGVRNSSPNCTWPVTLNREYTGWAREQARNELAKAGFRLAAVIRATMQGE
jgi:hypothetical protein